MPDPTPAAPPSPFNSILAWSANWPDWQRDALRRIVESGPLSGEALLELTAICRATHGLLPATGPAPTAAPLTAAHMPGGTDGNNAVSLVALSDLQNVGRLPSDQALRFGLAPGLTVIYGENGAGKSGYARVIKKACRARGAVQDIQPDFSADAPGPANATIVYRVGSADTRVVWTDGSAADPNLGNIFVFDSFSARIHVGEDGPACFKPRGLDVLPELARACDLIKAELQKELTATLADCKRAAEAWAYNASTAVGKLVSAVSAATMPATIDAASEFTDADEQRLEDIRASLSGDPKTRASDTAAAAKRIRTFAESARSRAALVDDTFMLKLDAAIKDAETTARAAASAAGPESKPDDLPWGSDDVWRELWKAARKFSETTAYPGESFPVANAAAKCVLCHQTLQPSAIDRFARFNKFVADETRKQADAARAKVTELKEVVDTLRTIGTEAADIEADLQREASEAFVAVEAFARAVDGRVLHARTCLKGGVWTAVLAVPESPCAMLVALADALDVRARHELAAADPEKAKALVAEQNELTDKRWLTGRKEEVKAQIARQAQLTKLKKCLEDCTTNAITFKSGELHEVHVTEKFCKAFEDELAALEMNTLSVKLEERKGVKGERKFGVRILDTSKAPPATVDAKVSEIASEGEHRCIALAAFMAELSQASHKSAVVFDDPVSSMDHKRRATIASRLVREAAHRQVVVFTHDLAFICDLDSAAARAEAMDFQSQYIERLAGKPGQVLPGRVWDAKSCKGQMKTLNEQARHAEKVYLTRGETEYREATMPVVSRIRGACERIIELHLLDGVIKRHDSRIDVRRSPSIAVVTVEQWKAVHSIWKDCSNIIEAHSKSLSGPVNIPTPDQLKRWIQDLEGTIEDVQRARADRGGAPLAEPAQVSASSAHP
jgi:predicted methyltransferase